MVLNPEAQEEAKTKNRGRGIPRVRKEQIGRLRNDLKDVRTSFRKNKKVGQKMKRGIKEAFK